MAVGGAGVHVHDGVNVIVGGISVGLSVGICVAVKVGETVHVEVNDGVIVAVGAGVRVGGNMIGSGVGVGRVVAV